MQQQEQQQHKGRYKGCVDVRRSVQIVLDRPARFALLSIVVLTLFCTLFLWPSTLHPVTRFEYPLYIVLRSMTPKFC